MKVDKEGRRIKAVRVLVIIFILNIIFSGAAAAKQGKLQADQVKYYREQNLIKASGNAYLNTDKVELWAEEMKIDLTTNKLVATGEVRSRDDTGEFTSKKLTYNLKEDEGIFIESEGIIIDDSFKEPMHVKTPQTEYSGEESKLASPQFTACNLTQPHYHFQAADMVIKPEDKIIAYHVTVWEFNGQVPVFYTPIWIYSLKDDKQNFHAQFGHSSQKGWFVKTTYDYYLDAQYDSLLLEPLQGEFGQLYLDYFTKLGYAGGFKHYYRTLEDDHAFLYFYAEQDKRNKKQSPWITLEWNHEIDKDKISRDYNFKYRDHSSNYLSVPEKIDWFEFDFDQTTTGEEWERDWEVSYDKNEIYNNKLDLSFDLEKLNWNRDELEIDLDYLLKDKPDSRFDDYDGEVDYKKYLTDDLYFDYNYDYSYFKENGKNDSWNYNTTLSFIEKKRAYNWKLETKLDRDQEKIKYYNLPEAELTLHPGRVLDYKLLSPLDITFGGLNRYYHTWEEKKQHGYYKLSYSDHLKLGARNSLNYNQNFQQDIYSDGYLHWLYGSKLTLNTSLPFNWSNKISHNYQTDQGIVPDGFSRKNPKNKIEEKLSWRRGKSKFSLSTGYDLMQEKYDDLVGDLDYEFNEHYEMEAEGRYDLNEQQFKNFTTSLAANYNNFEYNTEAKLDLNTGELISWDNNVDWIVGPDKYQWHIKLDSSYDYQNQRFKQANLILEKEFHCRKLTLSYDHLKEETWVQYQILAFPQNKINFGTREGEGLLFGGDLGRLIDEAD